MKSAILSLVVLGVVLWTAGCGDEAAAPAFVEDIAKAAPDNVKLLLENDHLKVSKFTVPSQVELPMHRGEDRVVYSITDYRLRLLRPDVPPSDAVHRAGQAHWHPAGTHGVKNIGPIAAEYLVIERKTSNPTPGVTSNLAELVPDKARIVFENEQTKVIEVSLNPGDKLPPHTAASRLVYSPTAARLRYTAAGGTTEEDLAAGAVHFHDGGEHQVENLSDAPVKLVIFELM